MFGSHSHLFSLPTVNIAFKRLFMKCESIGFDTRTLTHSPESLNCKRFLLSAYGLGLFAGAGLAMHSVNSSGYKATMLIGSLGTSLGIFLYGCLEISLSYLDDHTTAYVISSTLIRLANGLFSGMLQTAMFAYIA